MKVAMSVSLPNLQTSTDSESVSGTGTSSIDSSVPSYPTSNSSSTSYNAKPCAFFARGNCRNGTSCRFSHTNQPLSAGKSGSVLSSSSGSLGDLATPPPPILINLPPGHPVYSIDVECVATAVQHNARSIAQVALVDEWSRPVFSVLIKQDMPVLSYITELTGLTKEILDSHGLPLGEGRRTYSLQLIDVSLNKRYVLLSSLSLSYTLLITESNFSDAFDFVLLSMTMRSSPYVLHVGLTLSSVYR